MMFLDPRQNQLHLRLKSRWTAKCLTCSVRYLLSLPVCFMSASSAMERGGSGVDGTDGAGVAGPPPGFALGIGYGILY